MRLPLDLRSEPDPALLQSSVDEPGSNAGSPATPQAANRGLIQAPLPTPLPRAGEVAAGAESASASNAPGSAAPGTWLPGLTTVAGIAVVVALAGLSAAGAYRYAQQRRGHLRQLHSELQSVKMTIVDLITQNQPSEALVLAKEFLERDDLDAEWQAQAQTLFSEAQLALTQQRALAREQTAQQAYDQVMIPVKAGGLKSLTLVQLNKIMATLDSVSSDHPNTNAGRLAHEQSQKLSARIQRKQTEAEDLLRELASQREKWSLIKNGLKSLVTAHRFKEALETASKHQQQLRERFPALDSEIENYRAATVAQAEAWATVTMRRISRLIADDQLDEAIADLETFADRIGIVSHEKRARTLARQSRTRQQKLAADRQRANLANDMAQISLAWDADGLAGYAFEKVQVALEHVVTSLKTEVARKRCQERQQQCAAALAAQTRLVSHINNHARPVIAISYAGRRLHASKASLLKGITFSAPKRDITIYRSFRELAADDIITWCSKIPGFSELETYRLAAMLTLAGSRDDAKVVLRRMEIPSDAGLRSLVNSLLDELSR
jgi:hypothetical protein